MSEEECAAVAKRLKSRDIEHCRPNKLTPEQRDEVVRMWLAGYSQSEVGRRYGITPQVVSYHVRRAGRAHADG